MKSTPEVAPSIKADTAIAAITKLAEKPRTDVITPPKTGPPETVQRILRWPDVHSLTGRSRTQVWRDVRAGKFPAPVKLGENAVGWYADEITAWQESRPRVIYAA